MSITNVKFSDKNLLLGPDVAIMKNYKNFPYPYEISPVSLINKYLGQEINSSLLNEKQEVGSKIFWLNSERGTYIVLLTFCCQNVL